MKGAAEESTAVVVVVVVDPTFYYPFANCTRDTIFDHSLGCHCHLLILGRCDPHVFRRPVGLHLSFLADQGLSACRSSHKSFDHRFWICCRPLPSPSP
jgi:hypothetical protein